MLIKRPAGHEIPEHAATPEALYRATRQTRRGLIGTAAASAALLAAGRARADLPAASMLAPGRPVSDQSAVEGWNNFYEFGQDKDVVVPAQKLVVTPWSIAIKGLVAKPRTIALDDLLHQMPTEQRVLRHRCVEGWAMTVPWTGFPLAKLVALAAPLASAKYVAFTSVQQPDDMPGLSVPYFPWPYTEGLALDEANHPLAFVATGMYGGALAKQDGAPIRLLVPWKYGFKSAKSIVTLTFTAEQPTTFWNALNPDYYGFWANVNPDVPNPAHSQRRETLLGTNQEVPTVIYNGYGPWVASLYVNRKGDNLFR